MWLIFHSPRQKMIMEELEISANTFVDWSSFCREVCTEWAAQHSVKLGGPGKIVEVDEAKLGKRKYNRGRIIEGQWILGGVERESTKSFYVPVEKRNAATLISHIKEWILPGTIIISDCWKAYGSLTNEGFQHLTVNHSYNFVDPDTGAHSQTIERSWRELRSNVPRFGRRKKHYDGYLAEFQFKRAFKIGKARLHHFLKIAGEMYQCEPSTSTQATDNIDLQIAGPSGVQTGIHTPSAEESASDTD